MPLSSSEYNRRRGTSYEKSSTTTSIGDSEKSEQPESIDRILCTSDIFGSKCVDSLKTTHD